MARAQPFTQAELDKVRLLHGEGWSAAAIAKEIGRSRTGVTKIASGMGLAFDRAQTAAATAARTIDRRAKRSALMDRYLAEAEGLLDDMHRPYKDWSFAQGYDKDARFSEAEVLPRPADKTMLMRGSAVAMDAYMKMENFETTRAELPGDGEAASFDAAQVSALAARLEAEFAAGDASS